MSLTDVMCKKVQPQEKQYRLSDTNGLSLRIDPNGKKYWSIRYTENGQRKSKALGVYPELSLKRAREIALDLRYKLKNTVEAEVMQPHFQEVAEDWFNNQKETWSSKHISNVLILGKTLRAAGGGILQYAYPVQSASRQCSTPTSRSRQTFHAG